MVENDIILECKNLTIGYQNKTKKEIISQDINLQLRTGRLIGLVGINGVGKSTFLRTITKMQNPLAGDIIVNNLSLNNMSSRVLSQQIASVFTDKLPQSQLTVYEIIALGRQPYTNWLGKLSPKDIEKVNWAIQQTQIQDIVDKKHNEISDGQLQKVMIARALAQDTSIVVLDEPTTHLDLYHKVSIVKLLKTLVHNTQKCIVLSTHDVDLAIQMCDDMIVMTPQHIYLDTPKNLIENNIFDTVFPKELISFDKLKGKFSFQ